MDYSIGMHTHQAMRTASDEECGSSVYWRNCLYFHPIELQTGVDDETEKANKENKEHNQKSVHTGRPSFTRNNSSHSVSSQVTTQAEYTIYYHHYSREYYLDELLEASLSMRRMTKKRELTGNTFNMLDSIGIVAGHRWTSPTSHSEENSRR